MEDPADNILPAALEAASTSLPAVFVALLLLVVTTAAGWGWSVLAKRRALARLRQRAGCAPLRILPSGRLHLLLIKSRKQPNLLTCLLDLSPSPPPPSPSPSPPPPHHHHHHRPAHRRRRPSPSPPPPSPPPHSPSPPPPLPPPPSLSPCRSWCRYQPPAYPAYLRRRAARPRAIMARLVAHAPAGTIRTAQPSQPQAS